MQVRVLYSYAYHSLLHVALLPVRAEHSRRTPRLLLLFVQLWWSASTRAAGERQRESEGRHHFDLRADLNAYAKLTRNTILK